jgi:tetratricopeptide (TPR) repeat protein
MQGKTEPKINPALQEKLDMAYAYYKQENYRDAIKSFNQVLLFNNVPDDAKRKPLYYKGISYMKGADGNKDFYRIAVNDLTESLGITPANEYKARIKIHTYLAILHGALGDYDKAHEAILKAQNDLPHHPDEKKRKKLEEAINSINSRLLVEESPTPTEEDIERLNEEMLQQALRMSMLDNQPRPDTSVSEKSKQTEQNIEDLEDEELQQALRMSMLDNQPSTSTSSTLTPSPRTPISRTDSPRTDSPRKDSPRITVLSSSSVIGKWADRVANNKGKEPEKTEAITELKRILQQAQDYDSGGFNKKAAEKYAEALSLSEGKNLERATVYLKMAQRKNIESFTKLEHAASALKLLPPEEKSLRSQVYYTNFLAFTEMGIESSALTNLIRASTSLEGLTDDVSVSTKKNYDARINKLMNHNVELEKNSHSDDEKGSADQGYGSDSSDYELDYSGNEGLSEDEKGLSDSQDSKEEKWTKRESSKTIGGGGKHL